MTGKTIGAKAYEENDIDGMQPFKKRVQGSYQPKQKSIIADGIAKDGEEFYSRYNEDFDSVNSHKKKSLSMGRVNKESSIDMLRHHEEFSPFQRPSSRKKTFVDPETLESQIQNKQNKAEGPGLYGKRKFKEERPFKDGLLDHDMTPSWKVSPTKEELEAERQKRLEKQAHELLMQKLQER